MLLTFRSIARTRLTFPLPTAVRTHTMNAFRSMAPIDKYAPNSSSPNEDDVETSVGIEVPYHNPFAAHPDNPHSCSKEQSRWNQRHLMAGAILFITAISTVVAIVVVVSLRGKSAINEAAAEMFKDVLHNNTSSDLLDNYKLHECYPEDGTRKEICIAANCLSDPYCSCLLYLRDADSNSIIETCDSCSVCGDSNNFAFDCSNLDSASQECPSVVNNEEVGVSLNTSFSDADFDVYLTTTSPTIVEMDNYELNGTVDISVASDPTWNLTLYPTYEPTHEFWNHGTTAVSTHHSGTITLQIPEETEVGDTLFLFLRCVQYCPRTFSSVFVILVLRVGFILSQHIAGLIMYYHSNFQVGIEPQSALNPTIASPNALLHLTVWRETVRTVATLTMDMIVVVEKILQPSYSTVMSMTTTPGNGPLILKASCCIS
jgi:hypothetical protein